MSSFLRVSYRALSSAEAAVVDSAMSSVTLKGNFRDDAHVCLYLYLRGGRVRVCDLAKDPLFRSPNITMSTAPPSSDPPPNNEKPEVTGPSGSTSAEGTAAMDVTPDAPPEETWDDIPGDILALSTDEIITRTRLIDNDIKVGPLQPIIMRK